MHTVYLICIYMGGCQNYGPFLGTLNIRCRIIIGTQKGTTILTTTHISLKPRSCGYSWDSSGTPVHLVPVYFVPVCLRGAHGGVGEIT